MKKLTCIAIDDEPIALLIISQFCERKGGLELTTFSEPLTGLKEIARCKPDLVFLDIEMNSISGSIWLGSGGYGKWVSNHVIKISDNMSNKICPNFRCMKSIGSFTLR